MQEASDCRSSPEGGIPKPAPDRARTEPRRRVTVLEVVGSTLAAALGVQKRANLRRDFQYGRPAQFIVAGVLFSVLFVVAIIAIVHVVLRSAGVGE